MSKSLKRAADRDPVGAPAKHANALTILSLDSMPGLNVEKFNIAMRKHSNFMRVPSASDNPSTDEIEVILSIVYSAVKKNCGLILVDDLVGKVTNPEHAQEYFRIVQHVWETKTDFTECILIGAVSCSKLAVRLADHTLQRNCTLICLCLPNHPPLLRNEDVTEVRSILCITIHATAYLYLSPARTTNPFLYHAVQLMFRL